MTPWIFAGVALGVSIARVAPNGFLKVFFLVVMGTITLTMVFDLRPRPAQDVAGMPGLSLVGVAIGALSSLMGGGAAAIGVPFLTWRNLSMHQAIGTCAAMGFPLSIAGAAGYAIAGWNEPGLPPWSVGYVYVPAFVGLSLTSMATAPLGARLAHRLRGATLRRIFALFLVVLGVKVAIAV
jgi:uncharacterized protein